MSNAISHMIDALALEVAAIQKRGGGTAVELRGGERIGQAESSWLYRFVVAEDLNLRDETPVRVTCGQEDVSGILVSFRDGVLIVAIEQDLGPKIAAARLVANDSFLIERLKERLEKVRSGEAQFARNAADRVIGLGSIRSGDAEPESTVLHGESMNGDQLSAVRRSLGSDATYVWGPPGTGKTTTLARIVEAHYRAGRTVLLVSNTNIAVDTALERVADRLKGEPAFHEGLVIRQGLPVKEELKQRYGKQVILEEIVARLGEALRLERERLAREAAPLEAEERSLVAALKQIEQVEQLCRVLADTERQLSTARAAARTREAEVQHQRARAVSLNADFERARTMGAIRRFFSGLNPEQLARDIALANRTAQTSQDAARSLRDDATTIESKLASLRVDIDRLAQTTRLYPPANDLKGKASGLRSRLVQIRDRSAAIDAELAALEQQVLSKCRILATTVYRTYLGKAAPRQFDVVVIDEASMLMPPLVFYAAGLSTLAVVVAGDFRQLPPIVNSDEQLAEEWLKRDVFEKAGIPERLRRREPTPHLVPLGTQYRMCEPICDVVNRLFYHDRPLQTDVQATIRPDHFPIGTAPLLYVNTAPFHPWTALRVGSYSRYNLFHALLVRNVILHLDEVGYLPKSGEPNIAIGAVAPYSAQARLIQALLADRLGDRAAGVAATVHRFQGNEKNAMVIDLTDSLGARLGKFMQAVRMEEDGARLLNVATSRARHRVVLIGNFDYLRTKTSADAIVRQLIDHFEARGEALELKSLLPLAERDWIDGLHRVLPASFEFSEAAAGAFTEGTFYPAFIKDLARAQKSIVIFSPFATDAGTGRWVDPLRVALGRGVRIRVLTRPPSEPGGAASGEVSELVHRLRTLGVAVDLRARMHEKIAIIDGGILWHGSLNILSHRDTHESMLRIESAAACSQLARFVSAPLGRRDDAPTLDATENPTCPKCGGATVWNDGRFGIWFECEVPGCDGKVDPRRGSRPRTAGNGAHPDRGQKRKSESSRACPTPGCNGQLVERNGRFGRFIGCTKYPRCRYTENVC